MAAGNGGQPWTSALNSFLGDILALADEEPDAVRKGVRALARCEATFRVKSLRSA